MCAAWFKAIPWSGNTRIQFSGMVLLCSRSHHGRVRKMHPTATRAQLYSILSYCAVFIISSAPVAMALTFSCVCIHPTGAQ